MAARSAGMRTLPAAFCRRRRLPSLPAAASAAFEPCRVPVTPSLTNVRRSHHHAITAGQQLQRQQQQQLRSSAPHSARRRRSAPARAAQQGGGFGEGVKRMAKQITGNLPVIGLISRWASTEGGVGNDSQVWCRGGCWLGGAARCGRYCAIFCAHLSAFRRPAAGKGSAEPDSLVACKPTQQSSACAAGIPRVLPPGV